MSRRVAFLAAAVVFLGGTARATSSCDPIRTFADGPLPRREIFISAKGHDESGTGSRDRPWATLGRALRDVEPGDAIRLLPGTYEGGWYAANLQGTQERPIWLGGVPGGPRPLIQGGSQALHLVRARYLVVENLEVARAAQNGINCDDGGERTNPDATRHVVFRNLHFRDIGRGGNQDALKLSGVDDFYVLDCEFARTSAGGSGIDHVGCHHGLIARCRFTDMGSNAIQCKGGSQAIEIRWNRFENGGQRAINLGGSTGFEFFRPPLITGGPNVEARDIRVLANFFRGSDTPAAFVGAVDCLVANNTIIEPRLWVLRILQETTSRDGYALAPCGRNRFVNNIVSFQSGRLRSHVNIGPGTEPRSFQFAHNLWHAADRPDRSRPDLPVAEQGGWVGVDPGFKNSGAGDFSLRTDSPAAGRGLVLTELKADLEERCYAHPPALGAWEIAPDRSK